MGYLHLFQLQVYQQLMILLNGIYNYLKKVSSVELSISFAPEA
jgi:hypothetical protein